MRVWERDVVLLDCFVYEGRCTTILYADTCFLSQIARPGACWRSEESCRWSSQTKTRSATSPCVLHWPGVAKAGLFPSSAGRQAFSSTRLPTLLQELRDWLRCKAHKKRPLGTFAWRLGEGLEINVALYATLLPATRGTVRGGD